MQVDAAGTPQRANADKRRTMWKHARGSFRHIERDRWEESLPKTQLDFVQIQRTEEYTEIRRDPGVLVRIYDDHCDVKFPGDSDFHLLYRGAWTAEME
jgi:hypothetical protein